MKRIGTAVLTVGKIVGKNRGENDDDDVDEHHPIANDPRAQAVGGGGGGGGGGIGRRRNSNNGRAASMSHSGTDTVTEGDAEGTDGDAAGGGAGADTMMNVFKKNHRNRTSARTAAHDKEAQSNSAEGGTTSRPSYRGSDGQRTQRATATGSPNSNGDHHSSQNNNVNMTEEDDEDYDDADADADADAGDGMIHQARQRQRQLQRQSQISKTEHIEKSAGTSRLNRILRTNTNAATNATARVTTNLDGTPDYNRQRKTESGSGSGTNTYTGSSIGGTTGNQAFSGERGLPEKVSNPKNLTEIANFCSRVVIPPLKVDSSSIGGSMLEGYPESMQQECLYTAICEAFESTGSEAVVASSLQYPNEYAKHKRSLGMIGGGAAASASKGSRALLKVRYVLLVRSTNRPVLAASQQRQLEMLRWKHQQQKKMQQQLQQREQQQQQKRDKEKEKQRSSTEHDDTERGGGDYDAMFAADKDEYDDDGDDDDDDDIDLDNGGGDMKDVSTNSTSRKKRMEKEEKNATNNDEVDEIGNLNALDLLEEEEISSFPALVCMTINPDGTGPDIRKLIPLDQLTTVQDLHSTVVQLAFNNGDTIRLEFPEIEDKVVAERPLDKERFVWSLLQIHAMLCMVVVERNSRGATFLPPLNVRNLDRAELQYVATINGFLKMDETLRTLLERQKKSMEESEALSNAATGGGVVTIGEGKLDTTDMDTMAYNLMMGNFATRVTLFHSEDERKDAEEILNSTEWTDMLNSKEDTAAVSVAERLGFMLQSRMRDLEAETCRRLIAWEDEKHFSIGGKAKLHDVSDARDTVDALALASLFKTLESLDLELKAMEDWLQDRAAAIKPLTDDCADIEEENRQLEQQWKSYDMLGVEMRRLLYGQELDETTKTILRNPASVLVYDNEGLVDVEESEVGIERIYEAGKTLLDAIEFPKKSGGIHLKAVSERANSLFSISSVFCSSLAQIIVTVMEQFKTIVVAGSDGGKVSKHDTHTMISTKIRDTQRKFQSALLSYIKLIEILAALSPEMLPALRDAYAEMVSEGILMKKRMKGYFQALPGKNAGLKNKAGKDLKEYASLNAHLAEEMVNAPDIRAVLNELLPVIAREAYFTSALFGSTTREHDGREKKRNFENAKNAVDKASSHFRYYMYRTCGIVDANMAEPGEASHAGDPMLCLVATIYLNEAMDNYVDREKKGGDHSLSLAYVRATILDLRKKADKQWVSWVEKQIEWIKSSDGIPLNGKRAGIFPSFARFPTYLDHLVQCCKEGRDDTYSPNLPGIKVIQFYLQRMAVALLESLRDCARRETTDQSYASSVMEMENTYFLTQAVKKRGGVMERLFAKQVTKANAICKESTDAYLGWMIKREFTALHELYSKVTKIRKDQGDSEVLSQVPKAQFIKTIQKETNREVLKEKIGAMFSRMEKHLSEEGDLLSVAWKALVKVLYEWFGRWATLCLLYDHKLDPSPVDIVRIAKAAGGSEKPKVPHQGGTEFGFKSILALGNKQTPS